jgi:hypothetical protein
MIPADEWPVSSDTYQGGRFTYDLFFYSLLWPFTRRGRNRQRGKGRFMLPSREKCDGFFTFFRKLR